MLVDSSGVEINNYDSVVVENLHGLTPRMQFLVENKIFTVDLCYGMGTGLVRLSEVKRFVEGYRLKKVSKAYDYFLSEN